MIALVCPHSFGPGWGVAAYVLGWIAVGVAFIATIGIPYVYLWCHPPGIDSMPPTVLCKSYLPTQTILVVTTCRVLRHHFESDDSENILYSSFRSEETSLTLKFI